MTASPLPTDPLATVEKDLAAVIDAPLDERADIFDRIHRGLTAALDTTALDPAVRGSASPDRSS